jgi:hypothetical protein
MSRLADKDFERALEVIKRSGVVHSAVSALASIIANELAQERERCARDAEHSSPRHTECGNRIAAAIRDGRYRA